MEKYGGITRRDFARITRAVQAVEGWQRRQGPGTAPPAQSATDNMTVRVSGDLDEETGLYPGWTVYRHPGPGTVDEFDKWVDQESVRVLAMNDEELYYGCRYEGRLSVEHEGRVVLGVTAGLRKCRCVGPACDVAGCEDGASPEFTLVVPDVGEANRAVFGQLAGHWALRYRGDGVTWAYLTTGPWVLTKTGASTYQLVGTAAEDQTVTFEGTLDCVTGGTLAFVESTAATAWSEDCQEVALAGTGPSDCTTPEDCCDRSVFPATVQAVVAGTPDSYTFAEVTVEADGTAGAEADGRTNTGEDDDPAYPVRAADTFAEGDLVLVRRNFDCSAWELIPLSGESGGGITGAACDGPAWLLDVPHTKCLEISVLAHTGKCACIELDQNFQMMYTADVLAGPGWVGTRMFHTCCGCSRIRLTLVDDDDGTEVEAVLRLTENNEACLDDAEYAYTLKMLCGGTDEAGNKYAVFAGAGDKNCDGVSGCDNSFVVKIVCVNCFGCHCQCPACGACCAGPAPPAYLTEISGFGGGDLVNLNIGWVLEHLTLCQYRATCGDGNDIEITLDFVFVDGVNDVWRLTIVVAGTTTYVYEVGVALWDCSTGGTLAYVSGHTDGETHPGTIELRSFTANDVDCDDEITECPDVWPETVTAVLTNVTGNCLIANGGCEWFPHDTPVTLTKRDPGIGDPWTPYVGYESELFCYVCADAGNTCKKLVFDCLGAAVCGGFQLRECNAIETSCTGFTMTQCQCPDGALVPLFAVFESATTCSGSSDPMTWTLMGD